MREDKPEIGIPIYQVDAFTDKPFKGNPAAVCLLQQQYEDTKLQSIATEMNLSETAFLLPIEEKPLKESSIFSLRWFTPKIEVPLCGHATLATSAVLFYDVCVLTDEITYETLSGKLIAKREEDGISIDFPADEPLPVDPPKELLDAVGVTEYENVLIGRRGKQLLVHVASQDTVKNLTPDFELMKNVSSKGNIRGVIVTSKGHPPYNFISRYFGPWVGVNEDPVTGAAHTLLAPYWSKILGKSQMMAYQGSARGGELMVRLSPNDRVELIGKAVIVLKGELFL